MRDKFMTRKRMFSPIYRLFQLSLMVMVYGASILPLHAQSSNSSGDAQDTVQFSDLSDTVNSTASTPTLEQRIANIDESLQLLNRRLEMMPMGPGLSSGGTGVEGGSGQELLGRLTNA